MTCLEVLEHVEDPGRVVAELARVTRGRCVVSVPWEPWFRLGNLARGKYVSRFGNHPEHVGAFRPATLRALLHSSFADVDVRPSFPWLVGVASGARA